MDNTASANSIKYCLTPGVTVKKLNDSETAVLGGTRLVYLRGPADLVVKFIAEFESSDGKSLNEALNCIGDISDKAMARELHTGLTMIFENLAQCSAVQQHYGHGSKGNNKRAIAICGRFSARLQDIFRHSAFD